MIPRIPYITAGLIVILAAIGLINTAVARYRHQQRTQVLVEAIETVVKRSWNIGATGLAPGADAALARQVERLCDRGALAHGKCRGRLGYFGDPKIEVTPLHVAVDWNLPLTASVLLDNGANPNAPDSYGLTPLHWAAEKQDPVNSSVPVARVLIRRGADINQTSPQGWTALDYAAEFDFRHDLGPVLREAGATHSNSWQTNH